MDKRKRLSSISELRFASFFMKSGYDIFFPFNEFGPIDILLFKDGKFIKVQVKTAKPRNGTLRVKLYTSHKSNNRTIKLKKYSADQVDLIAFYDYENENGYILSQKDFEGYSELTLRVDKPKINRVKGVKWAKKYQVF